MMETNTEKLNGVFAYLDFQKIHAYMTLIDWTWDSHVPSIQQLRATVRSLMDMVMESPLDNTMASTGGFTVTKFTFEHGTDFDIVFDIA